jgi:4-alpha-glucanotransferase
MTIPRSSGIFLHPTSLPGRYGIGDLGPEAHQFLAFLAETGQTWWQMLPLGPIGPGNSPYQSPSSFAGNPLLISPELLLADGLLDADDLAPYPRLSDDAVDFDGVRHHKRLLLERAFERFRRDDPDFERYQREQASWLDDFALFTALSDLHEGRPWYEWPREIALRHHDSMAYWRHRLEDEGRIPFVKFQQFLFDRQWRLLRQLARVRGIQLIGDVPIYVALDSADVWARPDLFRLDENGRPTHVAGVPPDLFNSEGQHWGNPLYRWDVHRNEGYRWWIDRLAAVLSRVDLVRLDHFRGFQAYWEIPAWSGSAREGCWADGPDVNPDDAPFLSTLNAHFGGLPLIAEDLGHITPPVYALRDRFHLPGMKILQYAFGGGPDHPYLPHNFPQNCFVYTGTHDSDTIVGWFRSPDGQHEHPSHWEAEQRFVLSYLGTDGHEIHWDLVRLALASVAVTAIAPLQDILGLGVETRMNRPGIAEGNWGWRVRPGALDRECRNRLAKLTHVFGRWNTSIPSPSA